MSRDYGGSRGPGPNPDEPYMRLPMCANPECLHLAEGGGRYHPDRSLCPVHQADADEVQS